MRMYVLWLLTAAASLAVATRAAHVRESSGGSLVSSYGNDDDPRPDVVNEETSDILGTGGSYQFRLPQPQINKQQQQHKQQQQQHKQKDQHKTKRPNTTAHYVTTSTTSSTSSSSNSSSSGSIANQMTTKRSTTRPPSSTTVTSGNKATNVTSLPSTPTHNSQQSSFVYDVLTTPQRVSATPTVANDEAIMSGSAEKDSDSTKKIIGSSVVTSVSVILNGNEPEFTDAVGHKVPKPQPSLQVASPIDLLNPDRYEFYTFDENGELIKRLMTMEEIQSIVANGDGENSPIILSTPQNDREPEKNVQDIVDSVQNVLNKEVESNKNISKADLPLLDTPDVSSSWSMILPAIFGNGGATGDIFPQQKPQQIVMIPDSELLENSTSASITTPATKRPKPSKRKPGQKRKTTTTAPTTTASTAMTPQVVQEELDPHESVYTGAQQYQNVAANMQNFDGFSQLQMQPIYHKLPEYTTQVDTTTRRTFVNNQEIIHSLASTSRPTLAAEPGELFESYGKRPPVVVHHKRPAAPHRHKTPNGGVEGSSTTKKPQGAHNKQKIKKKPTVATTTTTSAPELTTPELTTTSTTTTAEPTTTTTTAEPPTTSTTTTTTTPEPTTTTTTPEPITIPTTPEPTTTTTTPEPITIPTTPVTTPEPITTPAAPITSTTTHKPSSTTPKKKKKKPTRQPGQGTGKPHTAGEKRKPATGKPRPTGAAQQNAHKHQQTSEGTAHQTTEETPIQPVSHKPHRTRPRPHKKPTPSSTTTTEPIITTTIITAVPPTITTTNTENTLIVEHFPGYHPIHVKPSHANKRPGVPTYPVPEPAEQVVEETIASAAGELGQLKGKPLPTLAQIQQQHYKPTDTTSSFEQIMESLTQELTNKPDSDLNESSASEKRPITERPYKVESHVSTTTNAEQTEHKVETVDAWSVEQEEITLVEDATTIKAPTLSAMSEEATKKTTIRPVIVDTTEEWMEAEIADKINVSEYSAEVKEPAMVSAIDNKKPIKTDEDSSHVIKFEPLYAEVQEPIVIEVTTAVPHIDESTVDLQVKPDATMSELAQPLNEQTVVAGEEDSSTEYLIPPLIHSPATQKVETMIAEDNSSKITPPRIADLKPHLNMDVLRPTDQINMSDFQTQAATVASTLVDGTNTIASDVPMSSNETRNDIDFLISDVIQQMTGIEPDANRPDYEEDGNRLTNFAQLNSSFLLKPGAQSVFAQSAASDDSMQSYGGTTTTILISTTTAPPAKDSNKVDNAKPLLVQTVELANETPDQGSVAVLYTSREEVSMEGEATAIQPVSAEKVEKEHDKVHKAEVSAEGGEEKYESAQVAELEISNAEIYKVEPSVTMQTENSEKDKLAQMNGTEKEEIASTIKEDLEYESTTAKATVPSLSDIYAAQQQLEEQEHEKESKPLHADENAVKVENIVPAPFEQTETVILDATPSAEEADEEKKEQMTSAEEIITEIEKISDAELEKTKEHDEEVAEAAIEQEGVATTVEEFVTQTEKILEDTPSTVTELNKLLEEQSTVQEFEEMLSKMEEEENKAELTENPIKIDETEIAHSINEQNVNEHPQSQKESIEEETSASNTNAAGKTDTATNENIASGEESDAKKADVNETIQKTETNMTTEDASELDTNEKESIEKETNKKESLEIEASDKDAMEEEVITITSASMDVTAEETQDASTKANTVAALENSTEQDTTELEEDNVTNAANLQPQYTNVPTTNKNESKEEEESSSEIIATEVTTELPEETTLTEEVKGSTGFKTATDVMITTSNEEDSTETDEDAYIKLGESTTKYTQQQLNKTSEIVDSTSAAEEFAPSTENTELTSPTLPQPIDQDESESTTMTREEESEEEQIHTITSTEEEGQMKTTEASVELNKPSMIQQAEVNEQAVTAQTAKPIQTFVTQARPPQQQPQLNYDLRPDVQNPTDLGDRTAYIVPKLPTSPVLAALSTSAGTLTSTSTKSPTTTTPKPASTTTKRIHTLKPVSYYNKHSGINAPKPPEPTKITTYSTNSAQQRPVLRPAQLNNLMATTTQATRPPVKMEASPANSKGLEASTGQLDEDLQSFVKLCNELAFSYWKSITSEKISSARSLVVSPFALTSMLSMVFLGARGSTSGEMNEVLKLDDMVTFNPHLVFKNITDSVERATDSDIATTAFVREIFSDRANGKILQFFKEKTQQFYAGHVEEVNFHVVNDVIRRRTNLLVKRHTMGKVLEYLRTNSLWVNGPLATISANLFQTDCRHGSTHLSDGEMFFQVHPSVRQRRLIPIPAVMYKSGFTAGYEPQLDATIVAFGSIQDTVSTIYVMPGHQSTLSPAESLERLEQELVEQAISKNAWSSILTSLMDRPGMEVQLPRFSHRSFVNASLGLQKMGLKGLFKSQFADLRGLTGSSNRDIYLSDVIQINTFSTCGEEKIADHHHVEMYPAPPLRKRNKDLGDNDDDAYDSSEAVVDFGSLVHESALGRGFYDDLLDPKYLELPLSLRPRQARVPDAPRLRFDKPFLYFVRHNPTGIILFMGRFNPRLLP